MKILVATAVKQGERNNDYNWCTEGELVLLGLICATDRRNPDGGCGCGRGFSGLDSHRATTTARVAEVPMSLTEYADTIRSSLKDQGYGDHDCLDEAIELARLVEDLPVGTILERRLERVRVRSGPAEVSARA